MLAPSSPFFAAWPDAISPAPSSRSMAAGRRHNGRGEVAGVCTTYAEFIQTTQWSDVAPLAHEAKRSILNYFATALAPAHDPPVTLPVPSFAPTTENTWGRERGGEADRNVVGP